MMIGQKLKILTTQEYDFLEERDPEGAYDRKTRETLYKIIQKLGDNNRRCSRREKKIYKKFAGANFTILLREGTESEGKILHPGGVLVEGRFQGEILIKDTITVTGTGLVLAKISAGTVDCKGRIEGDIQALHQVILREGGRIHGNIFTPSIHIEEGGQFDGRLTMPRQPDECTIMQMEKRKIGKALSRG
ncbi:MAG: polymer-forming cytoskeletal protein [Nitrospinaceae bacterium]